ncbi:desmocollin 2-like protein [Parambassis ranga]|uniref:Desmocollin 2-like protein n=1 Tax=Parambassis ranga TaxID=210632 RepID=A0A6P7K2Y3_9TELE|nr:desmocollin-2 [Parambassis ranga]
MGTMFISNILLILIVFRVESCFVSNSLYVVVPRTIPAGYQIAQVDIAHCDTKSTQLTVKDPSFSVKSNGAIITLTPVSVETAGRTFSVRAQDRVGPESEMEVHLLRSAMQKRDLPDQVLLKRYKRRWSPPAFNIPENDNGTFPKDIERIVSDSSVKFNVYYEISGPGVDMPPIRVFSIDSRTAMLRVHKAVDREEFPSFKLWVRVRDEVTNKETDKPLDITIDVDDENDNAPQFKDMLQFSVPEQSIRAVVGQVNATDRDQNGTLHVKIRYTLLSGLDLFAINPSTGVITTTTNTLDRETKDKHLVIVEIRDRDGAETGLATTGTATIMLTDINDNPPTFRETSYSVSVKENESEKLILRIPVDDKDLINTPNWISKFVITKGNENGNFRIDTDPKTNEGLLYVTKPLDYEQSQNVKLEISAQNQAPLSGTTGQWLSIPVNVAVSNVDEGPQFIPPIVRFTVKENIPNDTLIGTYTAMDPETKSSSGIKYYKLTDPASWINVDRDNGALKVANTIDRESSFVQDGIYNITVKAVDASSKTGTGTVIIQIDDVNDNMPELPDRELVLCEKEGELGSVLLVAEDKDQPPFSAPFSFQMPQDHDGKWSVTRFNDTAATLQQLKDLPTGIHLVPVAIKDLQGYGKTQTAKVRICQCSRAGVCLAKERSVSFGGMGWLALLLPLLLLLLLLLLLAFFCMTKREKIEIDDAGDSGGILLKSNTEAPGDEVDSSLINVPTIGGYEPPEKGSVKGSLLNAGWMGNQSMSTMGHENGIYKMGITSTNAQDFYSSQYDNQYKGQNFGGQFESQFGGQFVGSGVNFTQDAAFHRNWQTNGRYIHQKLAYLGTEQDGRYADDILHSYGFEGAGSAAGSVGCCSDYGDNDNLDFLNTLGPKFKTLADVCTKK